MACVQFFQRILLLGLSLGCSCDLPSHPEADFVATEREGLQYIRSSADQYASYRGETYRGQGLFEWGPVGYAGVTGDVELAAHSLPQDDASLRSMLSDRAAAVRTYGLHLLAEKGLLHLSDLERTLLDDGKMLCASGCSVRPCTVAETIAGLARYNPDLRQKLGQLADSKDVSVAGRAGRMLAEASRVYTLDTALEGVPGVSDVQLPTGSPGAPVP